MQKARETFRKYDIDGDGTVTSEELYRILKGMMENLHTPEDAETRARTIMNIIDADGDGNITFIEYIKGYDLWSDVENAFLEAKVDYREQAETARKQLEDLAGRQKQAEADQAAARDHLSRVQHDCAEWTQQRVALERKIAAILAGKEEPTSAKTEELRADLSDTYSLLTTHGLVEAHSSSFHNKLQTFLVQHPYND